MKSIVKEFIFSEAEGHQVAFFIKKGVVLCVCVWRWEKGEAGVFSVLDRNTSLKNIF